MVIGDDTVRAISLSLSRPNSNKTVAIISRGETWPSSTNAAKKKNKNEASLKCLPVFFSSYLMLVG